MSTTRTQQLIAIALVCALAMTTTIARAADPATVLPSTELRAGGAGSLPSWNDVADEPVLWNRLRKLTGHACLPIHCVSLPISLNSLGRYSNGILVFRPVEASNLPRGSGTVNERILGPNCSSVMNGARLEPDVQFVWTTGFRKRAARTRTHNRYFCRWGGPPRLPSRDWNSNSP